MKQTGELNNYGLSVCVATDPEMCYFQYVCMEKLSNDTGSHLATGVQRSVGKTVFLFVTGSGPH